MKTPRHTSQGGSGGARLPRLGATALLALSIMLGLSMIVATRILTFYLVAAEQLQEDVAARLNMYAFIGLLPACFVSFGFGYSTTRSGSKRTQQN